jgi:hypothetical protein
MKPKPALQDNTRKEKILESRRTKKLDERTREWARRIAEWNRRKS